MLREVTLFVRQIPNPKSYPGAGNTFIGRIASPGSSPSASMYSDSMPVLNPNVIASTPAQVNGTPFTVKARCASGQR
ncbi:MAG: hypothetical protein QGF90_19490, partial [Gammaproteobacteria bacterium]|nr:hypothetical protein [Gammaproteobacteria bacterium]